MEEKKVILDIRNFSVSFEQYEKGLKKTKLSTIRELDVTIHLHGGGMARIIFPE